MELTEQDVDLAIKVVVDSFQETIKTSMRRPSGLYLAAVENSLTPKLNSPERSALEAAMAITSVRSAVNNSDVEERWIFMFVCGYVYEGEKNLKDVFRKAMRTDYLDDGFAGLTREQLMLFKSSLATRLHEALNQEGHEKNNAATMCWIIGSRVYKYVKDGQSLNDIFIKEWITSADDAE